jgi:antitoxin ParD1/3/4
MKIITINLPEKYLNAIQALNDLGIYPSRSEAIRIALRDFLKEELKMYNDLDDEKFKMIIRSSVNKFTQN